MSDSLWFRGLKYAESIGVREATEQLYRNEFEDDCHDFDKGVSDYIDYAKEHLRENDDRTN